MKRLFILVAMSIASATTMAQMAYYQDKTNVDMLRHATPHEVVRNEFILPEVGGYKVLKSDLHTHSIYSDGSVLPEYRAREAWVDGLDVLAITEHIEWRPREGEMMSFLKGYFACDAQQSDGNTILADLNVANRAAMAAASDYGITVIPGAEITRNPHTVGHYNALFVQDVNTMYDPDPAESIRKARAQGAIIMHNHPGWVRTSVEMLEFEKQVYGEGLIDGVEVMNGEEFYPPIIDRASEMGLFISANTDIHGTTAMDYVAQGHRRNMTFILAKDNTLESIKEALLSRRTLAYSFGSLAGEESLVREFFTACVQFDVVGEGADGKRLIRMSNPTSMPFVITFGDNSVELRPFTSRNVSVAKGADVVFMVENLWIPTASHHPEFTISL